MTPFIFALFSISAMAAPPGNDPTPGNHPPPAARTRTAGSRGLGLGSSTAGAGISGKYFLTDKTSLQGVLSSWGGWGYSGYVGYRAGLGLNVDYLYEMPVIVEGDAAELAWNIGGGAGVGFFSSATPPWLAAAAVAGLEVAFKPVPIELVLEYRPTLWLSPGPAFGLLGATGHLRYFW